MLKFIVAGAIAASLAACGSQEADEPTAADNSADTTAMPEAPASPAQMGAEDALVAGTDYNATTILDCGFDNKPPTQSCNAGVKRNWGDTPGENLVEVTKPDGTKRAIFFKGTTPYGADSAQADGSAGWDFETSRDGDRVTVTFGPETYVIVDALVEGG